MKCSKCRRPITGVDQKKMVLIKDDNGKLREARHYKCDHIMRREAMMESRGRTSAPTAYEMSADHKTADDFTDLAKTRLEKAETALANLKAVSVKYDAIETTDGKVNIGDLIATAEQDLALAKRQAELETEHEKEPRPEQWSDHRDPVTKDV